MLYEKPEKQLLVLTAGGWTAFQERALLKREKALEALQGL
jgi:hypothetical protein